MITVKVPITHMSCLEMVAAVEDKVHTRTLHCLLSAILFSWISVATKRKNSLNICFRGTISQVVKKSQKPTASGTFQSYGVSTTVCHCRLSTAVICNACCWYYHSVCPYL